MSLDDCLNPAHGLRPGEVGLRMRPRKRGESWADALDEVLERARTGVLLPGDIVGTPEGERVIGSDGKPGPVVR